MKRTRRAFRRAILQHPLSHIARAERGLAPNSFGLCLAFRLRLAGECRFRGLMHMASGQLAGEVLVAVDYRG
jgi:hypothetical protein